MSRTGELVLSTCPDEVQNDNDGYGGGEIRGRVWGEGGETEGGGGREGVDEKGEKYHEGGPEKDL